MNKLNLSLFCAFFFAAATILNAQNESDFYQASKYKITKDFVKDYGADNDFATDDSDKMQKAINELSKKGGGKLHIPAGNYTLANVKMQSNIHLEFDPKAVIRTTDGTVNKKGKRKNMQVFSFGFESDVVENVMVNSSKAGEKFTIDISTSKNKNIAVFPLRNIKNFQFSDVLVKDDNTKFSAFTLGLTAYGEEYFSPRNGVIKDCHIENADYGYGLVQAQAAKNVLFKNISGQGGVTLRLETGENKMNNLQKGGVHDIFAYGVACRDGNSAVMISPHAMKNGIVTIDGVTAENCGFGVRVGSAFVSKKYDATLDLKPGSFDPKSSVKNVTVTFGTSAQVKPKHFMYIPAKYQTAERTADTPVTNIHCNPRATKKSHAVRSVSVAAVGYLCGQKVKCTNENTGKKKMYKEDYTVQIDESTVKAIGFGDQKPVIRLTDNVLMNCELVE